MGFGGYLQANTAVDVLIGPFIDDTDGKTAETGLTLSQGDIKLSKNGQALAQKNDDTAAAHDANGYYNCELDATDTNTEGTLTLIVHESGALPVRHDFMVLSQAAYVSLVTAKDAGFMDVNIKTVGRADTQETEANNLESACANYSATRGLTGTALPAAAANAAGGLPISTAGGLDLDAISTNLGKVPKSDGVLTFNTTCSSDIKSGLSTQAELNKVPKSDGTTTWNATALASIQSEAADALTAADIPGAVWDEDIASHLTAGSTGELLQDIDNEVDDIHIAVQNLAVTGAALNVVADGKTLTAGTETSGTYSSTEFSNDTRHVITADGVTIDIEYLFTLPTSAGTPTSVEIEGYLKEGVPAGGDTVSLQVYNYTGASWDTIDPAIFTGITTDGPDEIQIHNLLARHVGTAGGDARKMRIRFYGATLEAGTTLNIDMINVAYAEAISTSIASILEDTGTTLDTLIKDIPTTAEFEARTLVAANYGTAANQTTIEGKINTVDGIVDAILVDTNELQTDWTDGGRLDLLIDTLLTRLTANRAGYLDELDAATAGKSSYYIKKMMIDMVNKKIITDLGGGTEQFDDAGNSLGTIAGAYEADGTHHSRKRMVI